MAESPEGATAEFFRRNRTLLPLQDASRIRVFEISLTVTGRCADVRTTPLAADANIAFSRLTSSDPDENLRYWECRTLAAEVEAGGGTGVAYPSAALPGTGCWNLAIFGEAGPNWEVAAVAEVARPFIDPARVAVLS